MTIIDAAQITPMEKMSALQLLAAVGYDPTTPKVKRAAEYFELWREKSVEAGRHEQRHQPLGVSRWIYVGDEHNYWKHPMTIKKIGMLK